jgi:hypothetical protein
MAKMSLKQGIMDLAAKSKRRNEGVIMTENKKTYQVTVLYDSVYDTFDESLDALREAIPGIEIEVIGDPSGFDGQNYSDVKVDLTDDELPIFSTWYQGESGDIDDMVDFIVTKS